MFHVNVFFFLNFTIYKLVPCLVTANKVSLLALVCYNVSNFVTTFVSYQNGYAIATKLSEQTGKGSGITGSKVVPLNSWGRVSY